MSAVPSVGYTKRLPCVPDDKQVQVNSIFDAITIVFAYLSYNAEYPAYVALGPTGDDSYSGS